MLARTRFGERHKTPRPRAALHRPCSAMANRPSDRSAPNTSTARSRHVPPSVCCFFSLQPRRREPHGPSPRRRAGNVTLSSDLPSVRRPRGSKCAYELLSAPHVATCQHASSRRAPARRAAQATTREPPRGSRPMQPGGTYKLCAGGMGQSPWESLRLSHLVPVTFRSLQWA